MRKIRDLIIEQTRDVVYFTVTLPGDQKMHWFVPREMDYDLITDEELYDWYDTYVVPKIRGYVKILKIVKKNQ
jgi:hypothetical protein